MIKINADIKDYIEKSLAMKEGRKENNKTRTNPLNRKNEQSVPPARYDPTNAINFLKEHCKKGNL